MTPSQLTRRDFLERATCAAVIAGIATRGVPASAAPGMFISLNSATSGNVPWPEFARLAARVGYGGVDWGLGPAKAAGLDVTRALFAELNIKPTIVNLPLQGPFAGDDATFRPKLTQLAGDAAFTAGIGCQRMLMVLSPTGPSPKDEYRKIVRDRLAAIAEVLLRSNIRLGMEFLGVQSFRMGRAGGPPPNPFIWTLAETVELAKDSGPNIGVILDAWHWHHAGSTIADILAAGRSRIVHVHVSDAKQQPPGEVTDRGRLMPGEGIIDLVAFFQALQKIGYVDGVSPEPLGRIPAGMPPEDAAKLGLETTTAVMKKAGVI